jgi:hypothetical protein
MDTDYDIIQWLESKEGENWSKRWHKPINPCAYISMPDLCAICDVWEQYEDESRGDRTESIVTTRT